VCEHDHRRFYSTQDTGTKKFYVLRKDKDVFNRSYRSIIDVILLRRYVCTDYFFCIQQYIKRQESEKEQFLNKILDLQKKSTVELTVHPDYKSDYNCLNGDRFLSFLRQTKLRSFQCVNCFSDEIF
jgi:hypothetical protein